MNKKWSKHFQLHFKLVDTREIANTKENQWAYEIDTHIVTVSIHFDKFSNTIHSRAIVVSEHIYLYNTYDIDTHWILRKNVYARIPMTHTHTQELSNKSRVPKRCDRCTENETMVNNKKEIEKNWKYQWNDDPGETKLISRSSFIVHTHSHIHTAVVEMLVCCILYCEMCTTFPIHIAAIMSTLAFQNSIRVFAVLKWRCRTSKYVHER